MAMAQQLLERHGIVTREAVNAEGVVGGFTAVYGVLKVLEERGQVRRGYFVSGLGAAQFALPGAVDRLRTEREPNDESPPVVLAATDPAQPYGAALSWPSTGGRPARTTTAVVVLDGGEARVLLEAKAHALVCFDGHTGDDRWVTALVSLVGSGHERSLEIRKIDGESVSDSAVSDRLRTGGFVDGYKGLVYRPG